MMQQLILPIILICLAVYIWLYPGNILISVGKKAPDSWLKQHKNKIDVVGISVEPELFTGLQLCGFFIGILLTIYLWVNISIGTALLGISFALASLVLPGKWLDKKEQARIADLEKEFPVMITLVRVYCKASDLYRALFIVKDAVEGELKKQLTILAAEMAVNSMQEALDNFAVRCNYLPISNFVAVLKYGLITGSDIDDILATFSHRVYTQRVNAIKRRIKMKPILMTIIPAFMTLLLMMLLVVPMYSNIIARLQGY